MIFDTAGLYLETVSGNEAKIAAIDNIIATLLTTAATAAGSDNISEYSLNDGQVIIKTLYRGSDSIYEAIKNFEKLRQFYISRINGRVIRLVHEKNFIGRPNPR